MILKQFFQNLTRNLKTQDNRMTDQPMFIVQEKERIGGMDSEYATGDFVWVDSDGESVDELRAKRLELLDADYRSYGKYRKCYYKEIWVFVTACFTEQGCKDYLAINAHNLNEPRIYGWGSYRNDEYQTIRNMLMED